LDGLLTITVASAEELEKSKRRREEKRFFIELPLGEILSLCKGFLTYLLDLLLREGVGDVLEVSWAVLSDTRRAMSESTTQQPLYFQLRPLLGPYASAATPNSG